MTTEPRLEYPDADDARSPADTFRILFLDGSPHVDRLKEACKDDGYVVVGAETIAEAMAFLEGKNHVDVIVCAAHLETESMFAFLEHVRADELHKVTKFLILSLASGTHGARLDRSAAQAGALLGANDYVIMPTFDAPALIACIRELQPDVPTLQLASDEEQARSE